MTSKKILIIEDEKNLARFVSLELEHEGYATEIKDNGRSGLEEATSKDYDLILLDLMLIPFWNPQLLSTLLLSISTSNNWLFWYILRNKT